MGMTMAEKVLARTSGQDVVEAGQNVTARIDRMMTHEGFVMCAMTLQGMKIEKLNDPDKVVVLFDHYFPAPEPKYAEYHDFSRKAVKAFGIKNYLGYPGVCHQVMCEKGFVLPGQLILGTDSHSSTYGALGAAGAGIGTTEMSYAMATGELWMQVPKTIRINLEGEPGNGLSAKDMILYIAGKYGTDFAQYKSIEFVGPLAEQMSISGRMTVSNMGIEVGAKFALFEADQKTLDFLKPVGKGPAAVFKSDDDAVFEEELTVDISSLEPQVACPHNPGNAKTISEVGDVAVDQVYLGSCTNGRIEDMAVAAKILKGKKVSDSTRLLVNPASREVLMDMIKTGYLEILMEAGAHMITPGCGACLGGHLGLIGKGETCLASTNRNFPGRMGSGESFVYLGSPATVAASAITGKITDPREFWQGTSF
ncbi:3-isopropylmalate dehydratase large subunit [bacterium]|nr:3-isopropylmalate dehydratase large subunit [bacterium]